MAETRCALILLPACISSYRNRRLQSPGDQLYPTLPLNRFHDAYHFTFTLTNSCCFYLLISSDSLFLQMFDHYPNFSCTQPRFLKQNNKSTAPNHSNGKLLSILSHRNQFPIAVEDISYMTFLHIVLIREN